MSKNAAINESNVRALSRGSGSRQKEDRFGSPDGIKLIVGTCSDRRKRHEAKDGKMK
jgi:hypothetical protein